MKKFNDPNPNDFESIDMILDRIEIDFQTKPVLIMTGVEAKPLIKEDHSGFADLKRIPLIVYKTGSIYHGLAYNDSLQEAFTLFKSVLDDSEQKSFDEFFNRCDYQKAVNFLTENTF